MLKLGLMTGNTPFSQLCGCIPIGNRCLEQADDLSSEYRQVTPVSKDLLHCHMKTWPFGDRIVTSDSYSRLCCAYSQFRSTDFQFASMSAPLESRYQLREVDTPSIENHCSCDSGAFCLIVVDVACEVTEEKSECKTFRVYTMYQVPAL